MVETLEEALIEIERLNNELAQAKQVKGDRVIVDNFVEGCIDLLDIPVPFADFKKEDGSYHTINSYCAITNRKPILNSDGTRFIFGYELSDLFNVYSSLKQILLEGYGRELGGEDFTRVGDNLIWVLTYSEKDVFLSKNPNWVVAEEI